jgi:hypothetical protein
MVAERRLWTLGNVLLAIVLGIICVGIEMGSIVYFGLDKQGALILGFILITLYSIILFFLLDPVLLREIKHTTVKTVEKPVVRTVDRPVIQTIDRPVIKEVIKTVEKPVYREVIKTVEKPVYRDVIKTVDRPVIKYVDKIRYVNKMSKPVVVTKLMPRKKLNIKIYDYLGSSETMTYHKHGCRFSKLIKQKYRVNNDSAQWFKKHKYHPCQVCVTKKVKV